MLEDKDRATIIWNEYENQNDWQRHNESQRAQLATVLLAISAAIVTLIPKDRPLQYNDWPVPAFLIGIGVFGVLAVMKYWERFSYHLKLETAYRKVLDSYFATIGDHPHGKEPLSDQPNLFIKTREEAISEHDTGWRPFFKDRHLKQHHLWEGVFALITLLGVYLIARALSLI